MGAMAVEEEEENWREKAESLEDAVAPIPCRRERNNNEEDSLPESGRFLDSEEGKSRGDGRSRITENVMTRSLRNPTVT